MLSGVRGNLVADWLVCDLYCMTLLVIDLRVVRTHVTVRHDIRQGMYATQLSFRRFVA